MPRYLLDTNILLHYIRGSELARRVEATYQLTTLIAPADAPLVSIVSEGEIRALALEFGWGAPRVAFMNNFLAQLVIVPIARRDLVDAYALISDHCRRGGVALSKNDLWIAATANVTRATLLTTDKDFDPLTPAFLDRDWIAP